MRAALISTDGQPRGDAGRGPLVLAGKTLARRQLDFAIAGGCQRIIALGDGSAPEAVSLRHAAEDAGASFQAIRDSHGLLGAVRAVDELMVVAPGLLPEAGEALAGVGEGGAVLVLPAGVAVMAGFERIDLARAWAGVAVLPGALVERLAELPADVEPASALMRAALQARVPERRLPEALLTGGLWSMLSAGADPVATERAWLRQHARPMPALPGPIGRLPLSLAARLLAAPRSAVLLAGAGAAMLAGAVAAAAFGIAALGFALIPVAVLLIAGSLETARLREAPFGRARARWAPVLPWLVDAAIGACGVLAIEGSALHRLFPPLVLLGALHLPGDSRLAEAARNRPLLAVLFAIGAGLGMAEPAIMLAALVLIAHAIGQSGARRG